MNKNSISRNLSKSENDLLHNNVTTKNNDQLHLLMPIFTKFSEYFYNYYNKTNNDIQNMNLKNKLLYKDLDIIINKNNKLLFHFQLGLIFIFISIILNLYILCFLQKK
jgi:hypothetical protein